MLELDSIHNPQWNFLKLQVFFYFSICKVCLRASDLINLPLFPKSSTASLSLSHSYLVLFADYFVFSPLHFPCSLSFFKKFLSSLLITWNLHHRGEHETIPSKKEIYLKFPTFHHSLCLSILLILPPINARNHGGQEWGQWRGREGRRNTERGR